MSRRVVDGAWAGAGWVLVDGRSRDCGVRGE